MKKQKYLTDKDIEKFFKDDKFSKINKGKVISCRNCNYKFNLNAPGTKNRNHCPKCLYSLHVDINVGDRKSKCKATMEPIGKFLRPNGEEVIVHKCTQCGKMSNNRVAGDDDIEKVANLFIIDETDVDGIF